MKYTELEKLAHELCDNLPENKAEGWNWWNIDGDARIHWLNTAHDQLIRKAKAEAWYEGFCRGEVSGGREWPLNPHTENPYMEES